MRTFECPDHPGETRRFEIPDDDHADAERFYPCGRRVTGADQLDGYDPERDDFDNETDTPEDYEGDRYLSAPALFTEAGKPVLIPGGQVAR